MTRTPRSARYGRTIPLWRVRILRTLLEQAAAARERRGHTQTEAVEEALRLYIAASQPPPNK